MNDAYSVSLKDQIGRAWQAQKDLLDATVAENLSITPEEQAQVERMDADLDRLLAEEKRYKDRYDVIAAADRFREDMAPRIESARKERRDPTFSEQIRALGVGSGQVAEFQFSNEFERRALQSEGGSAVPTSFADLVSVYMRTVDPTLEVATVIDTSTAAPLVIPRLTADAAGGATVTAENGGITQADATISNITLNSFRYASIQPLSYKLWRDSAQVKRYGGVSG